MSSAAVMQFLPETPAIRPKGRNNFDPNDLILRISPIWTRAGTRYE
jgi:hypothetical protein